MPIYIPFILISFLGSLVGLVLVPENRIPILMIFSFFLLASLSVEFIGWRMIVHGGKTAMLYNIFSTSEFVFYIFFFRFLLTNYKIKKMALFSALIYLVTALWNIFFYQGTGTFHTYTYVVGCILVVIFSVVYFYYLLRLPEKISLTKNPYFWIVTGLIFFHTCAFSLIGLSNIITEKMGLYNNLLTYISDILNSLLYTLFTIGFLCQINLRKLLRLS